MNNHIQQIDKLISQLEEGKKLYTDHEMSIYRKIEIVKKMLEQPLPKEEHEFYISRLKLLEEKADKLQTYNPILKINPSNLVHTKEDERAWEAAKKAVKRQYANGRPYGKFTERNWQQVAGIFRNIKEFKEGNKQNPLPDLDLESDE